MVEILWRHELVAVPVDVDPQTLAVDAAQVERLVTPHTRAILIAHLFGSRMPLDDVARVAARHKLMLLEDCAQALAADDFRGHPAADVSLFSFGPIKTRTALGGALLRFRDAGLHWQAGILQKSYPVQSRWQFLRRTATLSMLRLLTARLAFSAFVGACRVRGVDYDQFLQRSVRGFGSGDLLSRIRRQASAPLLKLLERRLTSRDTPRIIRRIVYTNRVLAGIPPSCRVGAAARDHTQWVLPIRSHASEELVAALRQAGFDATRGASRLCAVSRDPEGAPPPLAAALLAQIVYLPMWPEMSDQELQGMTDMIRSQIAGGLPLQE
ncbi:MAG: DegT/DnrJ/EryC1/StrS family aminotransferase [Planctomycetia bacterium]|nr:DegT/DnrJ/EryC1/StrS family aminotransferase [Planctomycetia bacterium]